MGANVSASIADEEGGPQRTRLGDIPESCVALVLMFLDPPDVCRFAQLNRAFRAASLADFIWESKLPSNYGFIIGRVFEDKTLVEKLGKREIYARLCRPISFDAGSKVNDFGCDSQLFGNDFVFYVKIEMRIFFLFFFF